jgi:hypothetical protein
MPEGAVADAPFLTEFAARHELVVGRVSDLVTYRLANQKTVTVQATRDFGKSLWSF